MLKDTHNTSAPTIELRNIRHPLHTRVAHLPFKFVVLLLLNPLFALHSSITRHNNHNHSIALQNHDLPIHITTSTSYYYCHQYHYQVFSQQISTSQPMCTGASTRISQGGSIAVLRPTQHLKRSQPSSDILLFFHNQCATRGTSMELQGWDDDAKRDGHWVVIQ
jgi:hypothetical protein